MKDEKLSLFLLLTLHAVGAIGMSENMLLQSARLEGWPALSSPDFAIALRELGDKRWLLSWKPELGDARWKITEQGVNTLREKNLA